MASRPVNDAQRAVLDWLADGGSQDPPRPEMKLSAAALASRGLVRVRRPGGRWTAELTDAGRYYVEHGGYPPEPAKTEPSRKPAASPRRPSTKPEPAPAPPAPRAAPSPVPAAVPAAVPAPTDPEAQVPLRQLVRRPHPAVRELRDRPGRLPKALRRRCVLIAHALVEQALERGWTVTPVEPRREPDGYGGTRLRYESEALLLLDAGYAPVGLVLSEVTARRPHQDTKEEARRREKGLHVWAPAYDYEGTGRLRLRLADASGRRGGYGWTDGARIKVEDRLDAVLADVEEASASALRFEEARRRREEEERRRREEARRVDELRRGYEAWEQVLHAGTDAWARHRATAAFVDEVERAAGDGEAAAFVGWARGHLEATDPRRSVPSGEVPVWTHEQRARHGRYEPPPSFRW